jgi:hypothetical protein
MLEEMRRVREESDKLVAEKEKKILDIQKQSALLQDKKEKVNERLLERAIESTKRPKLL